MSSLGDDRWLVDDEGNLTPEVLEASRNIERPRSFRALLRRRVRVPLGILFLLSWCTLTLLVIVYKILEYLFTH